MFPNQPPPWEMSLRCTSAESGRRPADAARRKIPFQRRFGTASWSISTRGSATSRTQHDTGPSVFSWKPYMASAALADAVGAISGIYKLPGRPGSGACSSCNYQSSCSWATIDAPWMTFYPHSQGFKAAMMDCPRGLNAVLMQRLV